eukprot:2082758-Pyramimonas_sp.AAC.1
MSAERPLQSGILGLRENSLAQNIHSIKPPSRGDTHTRSRGDKTYPIAFIYDIYSCTSIHVSYPSVSAQDGIAKGCDGHL